MFYGSKHGGVKIYFIYLEKTKKQIHTEHLLDSKVVRTS
jgi:hypothetical protein